MSSSSSSSEGEWEDVESLPPAYASGAKYEETNKATAVEIVLPAKGSIHKGRKKDALEKAMEAFDRQLRHNLHKTSLLCLLAQGLQLNQTSCDPLLQARLFSLVPRELHLNTSGNLHKLLKWFVVRKDDISTALKDGGGEREDGGEEGERERVCLSSAQMLVAVLRALHLRARLVLALNPISFRPSRQRSRDPLTNDTSSSTAHTQGEPSHTLSTIAGPAGGDFAPQKPGPHFFRLMEQLKQSASIGASMEGSSETNTAKREVKKERGCSGRGRGKRKSSQGAGGGTGKKRKVSCETSDTPETDSTPPNKATTSGNKKREKQRMEKRTPTTTASETSPYFGGEGKTGCGADGDSASGSDSEFLPLKRNPKRLSFVSSSEGSEGEGGRGGKKSGGSGKKSGKGKSVKKTGAKSQSVAKKVKLTDKEESEENTSHTGVYDETSSWAEVYLEEKERYVCLHIHSCSVDQPKMCEKHSPHKLSYITAFETRESGETIVADVTGRYASDWCTATRRLRLRDSWWTETLQPLSPSQEEREKEEEDIMNILYSRPLPTSINDYKSHPLYVLRRHLLKFEAIYPVDSKILGYCRGEPVFSRDCVFTLHTRETWLKEGRVVKKDEDPYKVVKARPKKGQSSLERDTSTVEVFGHWQTEIYVPPPVVDGVVPRNEYGNVELFQPSMLPAGACHIRITGIQKVARKLGVSYAPAMIGWDFHSGHCCPVIDGIVVAEENKELLMEAWRQEEQMMIEKEMKKREARVVERWKKMARGVLIRERVQKTFSLTE